MTSSAMPQPSQQILEAFEAAWRNGSAPDIASQLPKTSASRPQLLRELIKIDLRYRWCLGANGSLPRLTIEDYVSHFPELKRDAKTPLDLIAEEYRVRRQLGMILPHRQLIGRFPEHASYISGFLAKLDAEIDAHAYSTMSNAVAPLPRLPDNSVARQNNVAFPSIYGYDFVAILGKGGMGLVYRAKHVKLKRDVAIKMILAGTGAGLDDLARFRQEAEVIARLQHPNIVQIYEIGDHNQLPYFALEFCPGGSLASKIAGTPVNSRQAAELVFTVALAVQAAHDKGIIHRDLKPGNILLTADGTPKVADFGLAKTINAPASHTHTGAIVGTPSYMSPEQAKGATRQIGPLADVYALGALLYELLTGRAPFRAETAFDTIFQVIHDEPVAPRILQPKVPIDLETITLKCLQKDVARRYCSARELQEDINRWLRGEPIRARHIGALERTFRWCKRNPLSARLIGAVAGSLLLGMAVSLGLAIWAFHEADRADNEAIDAKFQSQLAKTNELTATKNETLAKLKETQARDALAETQRQKAIADANLRLYRLQLYNSLIARAQLVWESGDYAGARQLLKDCIPSTGEDDYRTFEWRYLWQQFNKEQFVLNTIQCEAIAVSPMGNLLAYTENDGMIHFWDIERKVLVRKTPFGIVKTNGVGFLPILTVLAFSPDSKLLACSGEAPPFVRSLPNVEGEVGVFDVTTGTKVASLPGHGQKVNSLAFSADGQLLAVGSEQTESATINGSLQRVHNKNVLRIWDTTRWRETANLKIRDNGQVRFVSFLEGRPELLVATDKRLFVRNIGTNDESDLGATPWGVTPTRIARSSNSKSFAYVESIVGKEVIHLVEPKNGNRLELKPAIAGLQRIETIAFSPDDQWLIYGTGSFGDRRNNEIHIFDIKKQKVIRTFRGHSSGLHSSLMASGRTLLVSGSPESIRIWDTNQKTTAFRNAESDMMGDFAGGMAISADGTYLASGQGAPFSAMKIGATGVAKIWDVKSKTCIATTDKHDGILSAVAFHPTQNSLVSAGQDQMVKVWNVPDCRHQHSFHVDNPQEKDKRKTVAHWATSLAFRNDGKYLAAGAGTHFYGRFADIVVWDFDERKEIQRFKDNAGGVFALAWWPGKNKVACGCRDGAIGICDIDDGQRAWLQAPEKNRASITSLAFSPNGRWLAAALEDSSIKIWDLRDLTRAVDLKSHTNRVNSLCFSPDSKTLVSCGQDTFIKMWDPELGRERLTISEFNGVRFDLRSILFDPKASILIAGGFGSARAFEATSLLKSDEVNVSKK